MRTPQIENERRGGWHNKPPGERLQQPPKENGTLSNILWHYNTCADISGYDSAWSSLRLRNRLERERTLAFPRQSRLLHPQKTAHRPGRNPHCQRYSPAPPVLQQGYRFARRHARFWVTTFPQVELHQVHLGESLSPHNLFLNRPLLFCRNRQGRQHLVVDLNLRLLEEIAIGCEPVGEQSMLNSYLQQEIHLRPTKGHANPEVVVFGAAIAFVEQPGIDHRLP